MAAQRLILSTVAGSSIPTVMASGSTISRILSVRLARATCGVTSLALRQLSTTSRLDLSHNSGGNDGSAKRHGVPMITLYTGTHCSLCDVVKETLKDAAKSEETPKFDVSIYDIHDDSLPDVQRWRRAYQYDIPVIHLDGKEIARHRLDKAVLLEKLREAISEVKQS